jgi:pyrimidine operon attenuation protein/uracil phosphoribosyltransferase
MSLPLREKAQFMSASEINSTLLRWARQTLDNTQDLDKPAFVGIRRRGLPLAARLAGKIQSVAQRVVPVGSLDIRFNHDDLSHPAEQPLLAAAEIPFSVAALNLVLVDDVFGTGRTVEASYVGKTVPTTKSKVVEVRLKEIDGEERVLLVEKFDRKQMRRVCQRVC